LMAARTPRRNAVPPNPATAHLVRSTSWAGLTPGDPVDVEGMRRSSWAFVAHVRNERTGDEWVEVVGGRAAARSLRSFTPERIFPAGGGPSARQPLPSFVDAPQLPL
jgi:hypothetical protein